MRTVGIVVFENVEVLDFTGPYEVFSVTGNADAESRATGTHPFEVYLIAETAAPVKALNGFSVNPDYTFHNCPKLDILLIPGGIGSKREMHNPHMIEFVKGRADEVELLLSVCTGARVLAKAGVLDGIAFTTHHAAYDQLRELVPTGTVKEGMRYVDSGRVMTSGGITAGIDMSLYVCEKLLGKDEVEKTREEMEYGWQPA